MNMPALNLLQAMFPAIIQTESQSSDGINGYGSMRTHHVKVMVLCEKCRICGRMSLLDDDMLPCSSSGGHQWRHHTHEICTTQGKTISDAMWKANTETASFLRKIARQEPKSLIKYLDVVLIPQDE